MTHITSSASQSKEARYTRHEDQRTRFQALPGTVYFIGAGPGAPDLITVRGRDIIAQADLILYADSLVEESVAQLRQKAEAQIERSSGLHLAQMIDLMVETAQADGIVARVHSGDPSLYGAIHEQMAYLEDHHIPYEIVPGVTAAFAAAAQLKTELTIPDVVQTIIFTRTAGRTTMPQGEDLRTLAAPGASLAIYLSVTKIRRVVDDLLASGGYQLDTPVAVYHKVTWPDESVVVGTLVDVVDKVSQAGYTKQALILVSPALDSSLKGANRRTSSHLYDKTYTHRFRRAENFTRGKEKQDVAGQVAQVVMGDRRSLAKAHWRNQSFRQGTVILAITKKGSQLALRLATELETLALIPTKHAPFSQNGSAQAQAYSGSVGTEIRQAWIQYANIILVMPTGVAVRAIAPLLTDKRLDPAVVCLDEGGQSVIPLIGGHQAKANALAKHIATLTQGQAAITTASDLQGKPALDIPPLNWYIDPASALTHSSASLVNDEPLGVYLDPALNFLQEHLDEWLANVTFEQVANLDVLDSDTYQAGLMISHRLLNQGYEHLLRKSVLYHPCVLVAGLGSRRDVPEAELRAALETAFIEADLAFPSLACLATVDFKAQDSGLDALAYTLNVPLYGIGQDDLRQLDSTQFSPSAAQEKFDLPGVAEPCALMVGDQLLVPKRRFERCTVAIALQTSER